MDDFLRYIADLRAALKFSQDLLSLLILGVLRLTKFVSNDTDFAEKLNPENSEVSTLKEINLKVPFVPTFY